MTDKERSWPDLTRTRKAIEQWRVEYEHFLKRWEDITTDAEVDKAEAEEREMDAKVLAAYAEDTKDRNNRATIMKADVVDIIELVEKADADARERKET